MKVQTDKDGRVINIAQKDGEGGSISISYEDKSATNLRMIDFNQEKYYIQNGIVFFQTGNRKPEALTNVGGKIILEDGAIRIVDEKGKSVETISCQQLGASLAVKLQTAGQGKPGKR